MTVSCPHCNEKHTVTPLPQAVEIAQKNGKCTQLFICPTTKKMYQITFKKDNV